MGETLCRPIQNIIHSLPTRCMYHSYRDRALPGDTNTAVAPKSKRAKVAGCSWTGPLHAAATHYSSACQFYDMKCKDCGIDLMRFELIEHAAICLNRLISCALCQEKVVAQHMTEHSASRCSAALLQCRYCQVEMRRKNLGTDQHVSGKEKECYEEEDKRLTGYLRECPEMPLYCEYFEMGCTRRLCRKDAQEHYHDKIGYHASLVAKKSKE